MFDKIPFPKYKEYSEYKEQKDSEMAMSSEELTKISKEHFMEAKNILQKLINTSEEMRSPYYPKALLEQVQRLTVMNSLQLTKVAMFKG